jgi:hypothetical protein
MILIRHAIRRPHTMTRPILAATLARGDRVRSFEVHSSPTAGWEASEHDGDYLIQRRRCMDWHRVEQVIARFERTIAEFGEQGWQHV